MHISIMHISIFVICGNLFDYPRYIDGVSVLIKLQQKCIWDKYLLYVADDMVNEFNIANAVMFRLYTYKYVCKFSAIQ